MTHPRAIRAGVVGLILLASIGNTVHGDEPDPDRVGPRWEEYRTLDGSWNSGYPPPPWLKVSIEAAADNADESNASRAPTFSIPSSGEGTARYVRRADDEWA